MDKVTGRLENWWYDRFLNVIWGNIYADINGRFVDGTYIHTSDLPKYRHTRVFDGGENDLIQTLNSTYLLGKPRHDAE